jgi:branched-chain amino acid transport system substrate-binding protein
MLPARGRAPREASHLAAGEDMMLSRVFVVLTAMLGWMAFGAVPVQAADPVTIGFSMSLTGGFASAGKPALVAMQLWEEDINKKGGLLGRPVKLVFYDDQSNPGNVPGIYTKLLDVDKVDLVVGPYGTVMTAPAMPIIMDHNRTIISLVALALNDKFKYPKYFAMISLSKDPTREFSQGIFDVAMQQSPKPQTIAIAAADQEFSKGNADGARRNAEAAGLKVVYDKTYPPSTTDFSPIVRAVQATNPDIFYIASYPPDSVGMLRAVAEVGFKPKLLGGSMAGLQAANIKMQLGPIMNGVVTFENWLPVQSMMFPGVMDVMNRYQARAKSEGIDPLGYFLGPPAYAYLQVLGDAVTAIKGLDQDKLAEYLHSHTFQTVWGEIKFGADGNWVAPRMLQVQYRNVKSHELGEFTDPAKVVILDPPAMKSGTLIYPYAGALK